MLQQIISVRELEESRLAIQKRELSLDGIPKEFGFYNELSNKIEELQKEKPYSWKSFLRCLKNEKNLNFAKEKQEKGFYGTSVLKEINLTPSMIETFAMICDNTHSWNSFEGLKIKRNFLVSPIEKLVETPFNGEMVITRGRITGQALLPDIALHKKLEEYERINPDPLFVLLGDNGSKIICSYGEYPKLNNLQVTFVKLYKKTYFDNGEVMTRKAAPEELYAMIESAKTNQDRILIGGEIMKDFLQADLFRFDKNHIFAYLLK